MKWAAIALLLTVSLLDGMRDALFGRTDWWTWHLVKWAAFYPPLVWITIRELGMKWWILTIGFGAWLTWQAGLILAGSPWAPTIQRLWEAWYE